MVVAIERDLLHCFAGPVAEAVYRHRRSDRLIGGSGRGDLDRGHELISLLPPRKLLDAQSQAIARCSCLVHRYWPAVSAVAGFLQEHGTVEGNARSEEHTSELQSLMRISYAVFCLKKNTLYIKDINTTT